MNKLKSVFFYLAIPPLILFIPVLFFGKVFLDADTVAYFYSLAYFFKNFAGVAWDPFILSGFPLMPLFHYGFFYPLYQLAYRLFDFLTAYHLLLLFGFLLSNWAMYSLSRSHGISKEGSIISATTYTFSQWAIAWVASVNVINALYLLPILFLSLKKITEDKLSYVLLFAGILGMALLATHYQFIMLALGVSLVYFAWMLYLQWQEHPKTSGICRSVVLVIGGLLAGVAIGAPQLLATANFFALSSRSQSFMYASPSIFSFIRYLLPNFDIPFVAGSSDFSPYIGILSLVLGLIALRHLFYYKTPIRFFGYLFVFSVVVLLPHSPLFWVIRNLPLLDHFGVASRWSYLANFALAMLAGFGFDLFVGWPVANFYRIQQLGRRTLLFLISCVACANIIYFVFGTSIVKVLQAYFDAHLYAKTIGLPLAYYHAIIPTLLSKVFYNASVLNPQVVILLGSLMYLLALLHTAITEGLSRKKLGNFLVFGVVANSLLFAIPSIPLMAQKNLITKPSVVSFLESKEERPFNFRVYSFMVPFALYEKITALHPDATVAGNDFMREALVPNLNLLFEVPVAGGYEPLATKRMQDLLAKVEAPTEHISVSEHVKILVDNLSTLSLLNVKYIISPYVLQHALLKHVQTFVVTEYHVPLYLYENTAVLPRFYFVSPKGSSVMAGSIRVVTHRPDQEVVLTDTGQETTLVRGEAFLPGWHAYLDTQEIPITPYADVLQSVAIPGGKHTVIFTFKQ